MNCASPLIGIVAVSSRCNSRCVYCDLWKNPRPNPPISQTLNAITQAGKLGIVLIGLTGGEPILHRELETIIVHAKANQLYVSITTNGTLITKRKIKSLENAGCDALMFSLDTLNANRYAQLRGIPIDFVLQGIDAAVASKSRMLLGINVVVSHSNLEDLPGLGRFCIDRGLLLGITPIQNPEGGFPFPALDVDSQMMRTLRKTFAFLRDLVREGLLLGHRIDYLADVEAVLSRGALPLNFICEAINRCFSISINGDTHLCPARPSVGNIKSFDLAAFWASESHFAYCESLKYFKCPGCWRSYRADTFSLEWLRNWFINRPAGPPV